MMASTKQLHQTVEDVAAPVVTDPVNDGIFSSPLVIKINRGTGGLWAAKDFEVDFYPDGPEDMFKQHDQGHFQQTLRPGPQELHTRGRWYAGADQAQSAWVIKSFFVLTPPAR